MIAELYSRVRKRELMEGDPAKVLYRLAELDLTIPVDKSWSDVCEVIAKTEWHNEHLTMSPDWEHENPDENVWPDGDEELDGLDRNFRPGRRLRGEMYEHLCDRYGAVTVDALCFPWLLDREDPTPGQVTWTLAASREQLSESAHAIMGTVVPKALLHFLAKNREYGDNHRKSKYGIKGELIGLDRKLGKLYRAIWEDTPMEFEQPEEMLCDLIGAALLMLDLYTQQRAAEACDEV
jgi:hypothetical protein